jgi:LysM repeat protein
LRLRDIKRHVQAFGLVALLLGAFAFPAQAQTNMLQNTGFETDYHGIGTAGSWEGWYFTQPKTQSWMNEKPEFFPHTADFKKGSQSQNIGRDGGTFTAGVWQRVDNVAAGTALTATMSVYMENGPNTGARVRLGIGSDTVDPVNPAITWGSFNTNANSWQTVSVSAIATGGSVTVFLYATQDYPNGPTGANQIYLEDASLVVTGTGAVPTAGSPGDPVVPVVPTTPPQIYAPSVSAQDTDTSDGVKHTVQPGDTLAAIAIAYGTTVSRLRELNGLQQSAFLNIGQVLVVAEAPSSSAARPTTAAQSAAETTADAETTAEAEGTSVAVIAPVTSVPTELPAATNTPAESPTPTTPPPTPTPAATAVVARGVDGNPVSLETGVCLMFFEDSNQNRLQDSAENPIAGGKAVLRQGEEDIQTLTSLGDGTFICFEDVVTGNYLLVATAPDGYGLTTPGSLTVSIVAGTPFKISFGVAKGVTSVVAPTPDNQTITDEANADGGATSPSDSRGALGILFVGLAGVVLVGGIVLAVIIRRL